MKYFIMDGEKRVPLEFTNVITAIRYAKETRHEWQVYFDYHGTCGLVLESKVKVEATPTGIRLVSR